MNIVPVLLIKNEEIWIRRIVSALANVFPHIIVSDTGSTDNTIQEIETISQVTLYSFTNVDAHRLTELRQFMQDRAKDLFDATHIFLVDGDELYPTSYLKYIAENPMPDNSPSGFTSGTEICEMENGELWYYHVGLNRQAIIPVDSKWRGVYPFESPNCYEPGNPLNHYFPIPQGLKGFYHLHHTRRSRFDGDVYLRSEKKDHFSMRAAPEIQPQELWLVSEKEYQDV